MMSRWSKVVLATCLVAAPAAATETEADALFRMGREAMQRGDHGTACRLFGESYALDAAVGTLLNLARCEEELGRIASARQRYTAVMAQSDAGSDRHAYAKKRFDALAPRIPYLTLRLPGGTTGATVSIDGRVLSEAEVGVALAVDPGKRAIEVRRADGVAKQYEVTLAESEKKELEVAPPADAPSSPPAAAALPAAAQPQQPAPMPLGAPHHDAPPPAPPDRTLGWVLVGAGAAGLLLSGVAALVVLDRKSVVEEDCDENLVCKTEAGKNAADTGQTWSTIGTIAFVAGVAAAGTGTYLVLTAEPEQKSAFVGLRAAF